MFVRLKGTVAKTEHNKFWITCHYESFAKLKKIIENSKLTGHSPIDGNLVQVRGQPTAHKVDILVRIKKYSFPSKFEHNKGEPVYGWYLTL